MGVKLIFPLCFIVMSCTTFHKLNKKEYHFHKEFDLNSYAARATMDWWTTTENDQHCFKDNPNNKEILTVNADHIEFAVTHFYTRVIPVDIQIKQAGGESYTRTVVKHDANFNLEIANCYFKNYGGLFTTNNIQYTSFRLAD